MADGGTSPLTSRLRATSLTTLSLRTSILELGINGEVHQPSKSVMAVPGLTPQRPRVSSEHSALVPRILGRCRSEDIRAEPPRPWLQILAGSGEHEAACTEHLLGLDLRMVRRQEIAEAITSPRNKLVPSYRPIQNVDLTE